MKDTIFSPSFGNRPKQLIGRDEIVDELLNNISAPPGSKERATLLLGQRGYGKTVLLLELAERFRNSGCIAASPTAVDNSLLQNIVYKIQDEGEKYLKTERKSLTGGSIGIMGFSVGLQFSKEIQENRSNSYKLKKLCSALNEKGKQVVILVDEVQGGNEDLRQLILCYQEMVGEGLDVAVFLAGLPGAVSSVLNDKVLTFFNRSNKIQVGPLKETDVDAYYFTSFRKLGFKMKISLLKRLTSETQGVPYLMQLIGHYLIKYAGDEMTIDNDMVELAVLAAKKDFKQDICATAVHGLSKKDVQFLLAMSLDGSTGSSVSDISERLHRNPDYIQQYKRRLVDAGLINQPGRGRLQFTIPYMDEYIQEELAP